MNIEKVIHLSITEEEHETLKKAEKILEEVCEAFGADCEGCPLYELCDKMKNSYTPSSVLRNCIKALPVED